MPIVALQQLGNTEDLSMIVALIGYNTSIEEALKVCDNFDALLIDPPSIKSKDELDLAWFLAEKSFKDKKNIANKFKYEFLLWLTGKRDITSAMKISMPKNNVAFLILFNSDKKKILKALNAKEKKSELKKEADALSLEHMSLSRIKD